METVTTKIEKEKYSSERVTRTVKNITAICDYKECKQGCDCCGFSGLVKIDGEFITLWSADGINDWSRD